MKAQVKICKFNVNKIASHVGTVIPSLGICCQCLLSQMIFGKQFLWARGLVGLFLHTRWWRQQLPNCRLPPIAYLEWETLWTFANILCFKAHNIQGFCVYVMDCQDWMLTFHLFSVEWIKQNTGEKTDLLCLPEWTVWNYCPLAWNK